MRRDRSGVAEIRRTELPDRELFFWKIADRLWKDIEERFPAQSPTIYLIVTLEKEVRSALIGAFVNGE